MNNNQEKVPHELNQRILETIKSKIFLDIKPILLKLFSIHLLVAIVTLSICPQMGVTTFKTNINLMYWFMKFGIVFCDIACGVFFTGTSVLIASLILSYDELRVLRLNKLKASFALSLISAGGLLIMSPTFFLEFSVLWLAGMFIGTVLSLEIGKIAKGFVLKLQF